MPELPEVETVRRGLEAVLVGAIIRKVTLRRKNLRIAFPEGFKDTLEGHTVKAIRRRAKYLLFDLSGGLLLIAHLGMSGRFSVYPKAPVFTSHDHVIWELADGRVVVYNDARRFGLMTLTTEKELDSHALIKDLGPEPFGKSFSSAYLKQKLAKRATAIKPTLMDQKLVVGVGNIYASEALFLAKMDPRASCIKASEKAKLLITCIRKVLEDAIASGGSSLRDFIHVSGEAGYFQHHFNVYGRKGKPCLICGTHIDSLVQAGRTTFFCCHCQK